MTTATSPEGASDVRSAVRKTQKAISQRLLEINNNQADALADEINSTDDARRMFAATRSLAGLKKSMPIVVHDKN